LALERDPGPEGQHADLQPGSTQPPVLHLHVDLLLLVEVRCPLRVRD
jgi:hypothetical protein